ncbi:MAG: redoxin domain-containing protein [Sphingobacteriales bacterium JAD_PAG50586_3]|nr:MAG: redoxin domain-containing protein [Sphingobacteriales bacterium JAD_PAG50586_3]
MNQLQQAFSAQGVNFYGIIPGTNFSNDTIAYFAKNYNINMPLLVDPDYFLTQSIGATVTPEVVLLNPSAVVLYAGKVDNWYESIGTRRTVITQFYLKDALNSMLAGTPVKVKRTTPVGCFIF